MTMMTLVMLGLIAGTTASGSVVTASSSETHVADAAGHRCKCKSCRSATACCCARPAQKPDGAPAQPSAQPPKTAQVQDDAGPCVRSVPCGGGAGLPRSPSGLTTNDALSLAGRIQDPSRSIGRFHIATTDSLSSAMLAARLDDPPEGCSHA